MYRYLLIFIIFLSFSAQAQVTDIARVEYTYFPQRSSDNSFKRFRAFVNVPIKLNDKGSYLVPGFEYRSVAFDYEDVVSFSVEDLDRFASYELSLGYTFKMKNDWRFAIKGGVMAASNFETKKLISEDILYSGSIFFVKDRTDNPTNKPWRLILGLQYSTTAGRPFPLPFINYYKKFHPSWTYAVGVPKSNLKYFINKKNVVQAFVTLDGFYANIQNNKEIPNLSSPDQPDVAEDISMLIALAGLGYERFFTDHLLAYAYGGFTVLNDIRLRDVDNNDVLTINDENSFYIRAGIKFKI
ncbi:DUF6268 family outer membrane beta-barrel protein [Aquimarina sp. M1]